MNERPEVDLQAAGLDELLERWLPGAMFPSELVWLEGSIRLASADIVIECGRQDGVSTWTLATRLAGTGTHILSIDFDEDRARLARVREMLDGLPVTCVSGDIHVEVPRLLAEHRGRSIAVVQDGPKGWEGMATLLACAYEPSVTLVAQHNLHLGHASRTAFQMLALRPCFLEDAAPGDEVLAELRRREQVDLRRHGPNRRLDHSSLGVIVLDGASRAHLLAGLDLLRGRMAPWDPVKVAAHWRKGDLGYCSRLRARSRFTAARFKRR